MASPKHLPLHQRYNQGSLGLRTGCVRKVNSKSTTCCASSTSTKVMSSRPHFKLCQNYQQQQKHTYYHGPWSKEEEYALVVAHSSFGQHWSELSTKALPHRAPQAIRAHWYSTLQHMRTKTPQEDSQAKAGNKQQRRQLLSFLEVYVDLVAGKLLTPGKFSWLLQSKQPLHVVATRMYEQQAGRGDYIPLDNFEVEEGHFSSGEGLEVMQRLLAEQHDEQAAADSSQPSPNSFSFMEDPRHSEWLTCLPRLSKAMENQSHGVSSSAAASPSQAGLAVLASQSSSMDLDGRTHAQSSACLASIGSKRHQEETEGSHPCKKISLPGCCSLQTSASGASAPVAASPLCTSTGGLQICVSSLVQQWQEWRKTCHQLPGDAAYRHVVRARRSCTPLSPRALAVPTGFVMDLPTTVEVEQL